MSDTTVTRVAPHLNNTLSNVLALCVLLFNATIIVMCLWHGDPANSLHQSGMSWAFGVSALILTGYGIGAVTPTLVEMFSKR
jgi:hypothetical protein